MDDAKRVGGRQIVLEAILDQFLRFQEAPSLRRDRPSYVSTPSDNLIPGLEEAVLEDFASGSGGELDGEVPKFCAVYSSSALAANAFGEMRLHPEWFGLSGIRDFDSARFERKLPTGLLGTPPNLDFFASGPSGTVAVESKFTEILGAKTAKFSASYEGAVARLADPPWQSAYRSLTSDPTYFTRLDAAQLIKHYLGMRHSAKDAPGEHVLLYVYWEPENSDVVEDFQIHRAELMEFSDWVGESSVRFSAMTYRALWAEWEEECVWPGVGSYLGRLRERYDVTLPTPIGFPR